MMLRQTTGGVTLAVRAQPGAKKTAITGIYGEGATAQLKIAVQAPPIEGRANQALVVFLAELFSDVNGQFDGGDQTHAGARENERQRVQNGAST